MNLKTIQESLIGLNAHYPDSGHTLKSLRLIAEDWVEDFASFTTEKFIFSVKYARRHCGFFPKTSDIFRASEAFVEPRQSTDVRMIGECPTYKSKVDIEKNKKKLEILSLVAAGEIPYDEADRMISKI